MALAIIQDIIHAAPTLEKFGERRIAVADAECFTTIHTKLGNLEVSLLVLPPPAGSIPEGKIWVSMPTFAEFFRNPQINWSKSLGRVKR